MKNQKVELLNFGQVLGRDEMKQLMAGSGSGTCFICLGGVDCHPAGPGQLGWTGCNDSSGTSCQPSGSTCRG